MEIYYLQTKKHVFAFTVACAMLFGTPLLAQLNAKYLTQYTEIDGVPGVRVSNIGPDRLGYIWVGTINGLARYDGYEFKRYFNNPNDSTSIKGSIVWAMFEDHKGQVWVATGPGFLNVYNPVTKSFRQYDYTKLVEHPANVEIGIEAICEDDRGRIYLGITSYYGNEITPGLLYIDENDNKVKKFTAANNQSIHNVRNLIKDNRGNIWATGYDGILKIDSNGTLSKIRQFDETLNKNREYPGGIASDKEGHIWLISNKSTLYHFNPADSIVKTHRPKGFSGSGDFNKIVFDKNDHIWLGTASGLLRFDRTTGDFYGFKSESSTGLEKAAVNSLQFDSFGTLWMGTESSGLLKYEERAVFKSYSHSADDNASLSAGWANNIYETSDGKLWITTSSSATSGGINALDPATGRISSYPFNTLIPGWHDVGCIIENAPGELLIGTNVGNYQFLTATARLNKTSLNGVPNNTYQTFFYKDSKGNIWLGSFSGLFKRDKGKGEYKRYDLSKVPGGNAASNEITRAFESTKHGLWIATNNGLFLYNYATDKIERHGYDKSVGDIFITQDINSFYETTDGTAWVGTWGGGLSKYAVDTKKITTYTRENGLPSMSVQSILADEKNKTLWLSTFEGISRFEIPTGQFNNFSLSDGIQGLLFADGACLKTSGGLFVFGGSNGITIFDPASINKNSIPPKVFLTDLKLFNKSVIPGEKSVLKNPIDQTKEIVLGYNQNNISLEFIALHYSNPSKNKYSYKLENYDNEWREVGNQHVAFYPNLPPGQYSFRVKAANNNGVWNEEGATLNIIVNPPWWRTTIAYIAYLVLLMAAAFAIDRYFRYRLIEKERERNRMKELEQAKEIEKAYHTLEQTHETLKATQTQLIQSEKMASLGELTAGIAHEIQNPLNFVNNFSEVNTELIDEMQQEMDKGNLADAKAIANDIKENEQKINHHGKRADAIVKGMLQHSRSSTAQKELTELNALADEYLRLSYHGLRAKDKSFNASMETNYDETIGAINIIPQDIGRVLLNLYNNAFYAVAEKKKNPHPLKGDEPYEPTITVTTKKLSSPPGGGDGGKVEVKVTDNGNGIPQKVLDKIFQPFFTTKPTGQGTGLGLSLSYDIVKAHGGDINLKTEENKGSEFIVTLPI